LNRELVLRGDEKTAMPLICQAASGDAALLFMYLSAHSGRGILAEAASALKMTEAKAKKAADILLMYGVASLSGTVPPRKDPAIHPEELATLRDGDPEFSGLCSYLEGSLGRILRINELESLCSVRFDLNVPCETIMLMINYCRGRRRLSVREIERLAYEWCDSGITTYEQALAHIEELKEQNSRVSKIMSLFGLYSRRPSDSERMFIEKWIQMGFDDEMLKLAYERMMERTHEVSFPYLNAILERWKGAGITTYSSAVAEKERRAASRKEGKMPPAGDAALEAAVLAQFEKKRHQRELRQQRRLEELMRKSPDFASLERQIRLCSSQAARADGKKRQELISEKEQLLKKRVELLESFGHSADWLDNTPDCPICSDRGFIGTKKCSCLEKAVLEMKK